MGLFDSMVNWLTGRDTRSILKPSTRIDNQITLTTTKDPWNYHSYILDIKKMKVTESNSFIGKIPKKSNIKDIEPILDRMKKKFGGMKIEELEEEHTKTSWIDRYNRIMSTKIEEQRGISYKIRGDIANQFFLEGKIFVQCTTATCIAVVPSVTCTDLTKFNAKDLPKGKKKR